MSELADVPLNNLVMRRKLCVLIVRLLRTMWADDPRAPRAEQNFRDQLRQLDAAINARRMVLRRATGEADPERQAIGLDALGLAGKAPGA